MPAYINKYKYNDYSEFLFRDIVFTRVKIVKNKIAAPFRQAEFDMLYGEGISKEGEALALGEKYEVVKKEGQTYVYGEVKLGRGYDAARTFLRDNKTILNNVLKDIRKHLNEEAKAAPDTKPDADEEKDAPKEDE